MMERGKKRPPVLANWILKIILREEAFCEKSGDMEEVFQHLIEEKGKFRANFWYCIQISKAMPALLKDSIIWRSAMFKSYLSVTLRNIRRQRGYSLINIAGLAVGMACCMLILLWVQDELSFDRYHENSDRICRITYAEEIGGAYDHYAMAPFISAPTFTAELPEVVTYTRYVQGTGLIAYGEKNFNETGIAYVDSAFFKLFSYPFIAGDPKTALKAPGSIVLTERMADKVFGKENPVGKALNLNNRMDLQVTGVIANVPSNSHFTFHYLISMSTIQKLRPDLFNNWFIIMGWSYLLLEKGGDPTEVEKKFVEVVETHAGQDAQRYGTKQAFKLQKLTDIHLRSRLQAEIRGNGDMDYVTIFSVIALFILIVACINYMNLSTARSTKRGREVGMRKVLGAYKARLISQFLSESIIMSFLGLGFALVLVSISLPLFNNLTGKTLTLQLLENRLLIIGFLGFMVFTGLAAGSYPAFFLSSFHPVNVLKGHSSSASSRSTFRNGLVVFQFAISVILIAGTFVILSQLNFMKNQSLGFDKDQVLVVRVRGRGIRQQFDVFKKELLKNPSIQSAVYSDGIPGSVHSVLTVNQEEMDESESHTMEVISADFGFVDTYGIEISHGRDFSVRVTTDTLGGFLINETAAKKLGWNEDAVGKKIGFSMQDMRPIVGIVNDFHYESLKEAIGPLVISLSHSADSYLSLKIQAEHYGETISLIKEKWQAFEKERNFEYFFADDNFDSLYRSVERLGRIITAFALLAVLVASMGLFGLVSFTAEQRTKEVGIRRVLGASASSIIVQLSKEFTKRVVLANVIALPISYFVMDTYWLPNFHYRMHLGLSIFLAAGLLSLFIALITVGFQVIKAACANPVDSLKYE